MFKTVYPSTIAYLWLTNTMRMTHLEDNHVGFYSPLGLVSDKMEHIVANGLCTVIHQLFAAPRRKMCEYHQLDAKIAASTETH